MSHTNLVIRHLLLHINQVHTGTPTERLLNYKTRQMYENKYMSHLSKVYSILDIFILKQSILPKNFPENHTSLIFDE